VNIALALVIGKGDLWMHQEGQRAQVVVFQTVQQIGGLALSAAVAGMTVAAFGQNGLIASVDFLECFCSLKDRHRKVR
jgi:hypothetical protein